MSGTRNSSLSGKITIFVVICCCSFSAHAKYGGGTGVPNDPYLIYTAEQMNEIGLNEDDWDKNFKLMADIDLGQYTGENFNIIGYATYPPWNPHPFTGVFDGNGHTISNFTYTSTDKDNIGLFGYVDSRGEIKDLGLIAPNVESGTGKYVSALVGRNEGTITDCYAQGGSVTGGTQVGGLVGYNGYATISCCYSNGSVLGNRNVGGLVGSNGGTITDCHSAGSISGNKSVGGLVGATGGPITNCNANGSVSGNDDVGGLVGANHHGTITNSYATGSITGTSHVGGLVGYNFDYKISNCYSTGSVTGDDYVGGLVGYNCGLITNCYSTGSVAGDNFVGGLLGYNERYAEVFASFWNTETSGQTTSAGGTGKTTAELQKASTFIGWGYELVWTIDEGNDYPRLWWEKKPGKIITKISYGGGSGEPNDPYLIYTAEHLNMIGWILCDWDKHFKLMADIDLSGFTGTSFNIIGSRWSKRFSGVFDGNGHTISNFTYTSTFKSYIGLFGYVTGRIKDLGLIDPNVDAGTGDYVGSLVGYNYGTIANCYVEGGSVSGASSDGGLVGMNSYGTMTNCYATGSVSGNSRVGGLVGHNWRGTIANCYASGSVLGGGAVGGLVGENGAWREKGIITKCYSTGSVAGSTSVGGLVGNNNREITDSFWDIETSGQTTSAGGIGKTTAEMKMQVTFTDAGWDFNTPVWTIDEGVDYPRLWWEFMPLLHAEPEITLGTNNAISWEPITDDIEYYAECAEDADFTSIIYNSGWITETSYEFTDLELGKHYWYSVKARNAEDVESQWSNVESSMQGTLADAVQIELEPESLKNDKMKNALLNKIDEVLEMIDEGLYKDALNKLEHDILAKMNGCGETGEPDKNDWIITCEAQNDIYPLIIETIEYVRELMGE